MDSKHDPYTFHLHSSFAQLLTLIRRGHYEDVVEWLRREPAILKLRDRMGRSALHHCADSWPLISSINRPNISADIGQLLLRMMPSMVEWQDQEGNIPLHLAVINSDLPLVRRLLRAMSPSQINIADYELHTVIHWSVVSGQLDAMTMALDHGADPCTPDIYGAYPLHYATQSFSESSGAGGNPAIIAVRDHQQKHLSSQNFHLLEPIPLLPDISSKTSSSNLAATSKRRSNSLRILHHLLTRPQIDVNCIDNEQRTPLIWSASSGNHDALLVLVKAGAEISQQDKDGLSALHCASSRGHYRCVHTLITMCGANVHQLDSCGCTPLFYAVALGHPDCVRLLLECGAQLDHQDHKGRTAAHCGASKGQLETLKILHEHGANLWLKNVRGDLPLHDAVKSGRIDLVKWFLDQSPNSVNEVNLYGRSPLHIAAFNHHLEMCRLLLSYGADINSVMKVRSQYLTPLDAALQNGGYTDSNDIPSMTTGGNIDELLEFLRKQGAQPLAQIDRDFATESYRFIDHQNNFPMETDHSEELKFKSFLDLSKKNVSKKTVPLSQRETSNLGINSSGIMTRRSKSKPATRDVKIQDEYPQISDQQQQRWKSSSNPAQLKIDETEISTTSKTTTSTKLPNLVHQTSGHTPTTDSKQQTRDVSSKSGSSSSTPNSVVHSTNADTHYQHKHITDRVKNIREFETVLDSETSSKHPTHLKQAIITNVYLTTPVAATTATAMIPLTPVNTTSTGATIATRTALLPIYYVKRVPPLKKLSSSTINKKRTKKLKKSRAGSSQISVVLKTHDTFQTSTGEFHEQRNVFQNELTNPRSSKSRKKLFKSKNNANVEEQKEDEKSSESEDEHETKQDKPEYIEDEAYIGESNEVNELQKFDQIERELIMEERTPDSGFETEAIQQRQQKEPSKDSYQNHKESLKITRPDDKMPKQQFRHSWSSEGELSPEEKKQCKDSKGWLGSKLELMITSTKDTMNETVDVVKEKSQLDGKGFVEDGHERVGKEIPQELIQRDFVRSFNKDDEDGEDERKKRSVSELLSPEPNAASLELTLQKEKSIESLQSRISVASSVEEEEQQHDDQKVDGYDDRPSQLLIISIEQKPRKQDENEEPRIVEIFEENEDKVDDDVEPEKKKLDEKVSVLNKTEEITDTIDREIKAINEVDDKISGLLPQSVFHLSEINEFEIKKEEIKFKENKSTLEEIESVLDNSSKGFKLDEYLNEKTHTLTRGTAESVNKVKNFPTDNNELKQEAAGSLDKTDEKLEDMENVLELEKDVENKSVDASKQSNQILYQAIELQSAISELPYESETQKIEPNAQLGFNEQNKDEESTEQFIQPIQHIRRRSYTKRSSLLTEDEQQSIQIDDRQKARELKPKENPILENGNLSFGSFMGNLSKQESGGHGSSSILVSSFGPVRQLKGKKKSYDHIRPKVDSYWSEKYHHHRAGIEGDPSPCRHVVKKYRHYKQDKFGGSTGYLASTSQDNYARVDPKIINQTVEKYLRKYYLERQLFEELYDLKRYQIRTGRTNEPQSVRRLVDKFRREMKAPGMADFKGPFTYRAYEMYLYDLLRQLSRSNQRKIAYLTKSISCEDLSSSFERLKAEAAEAAAASSDEYHHGHSRRHEYISTTGGPGLTTPDVSSETSEMNGHHRDHQGQESTARHNSSKFDPLLDYERKPYGLVVDYKYEYHKSQHRSGHGDDGSDELVDVICENLYKRTGLHGSKMDEMAVSRKIVEKSGNEDNTNEYDNYQQQQQRETKKAKKPNTYGEAAAVADGYGGDLENKVRWPDRDNRSRKNDDSSYLSSRCYVYGHRGPSPLNLIESYNNSLTNIKSRLVRLAESKSRQQQPSRKRRSTIPSKQYRVVIPHQHEIHKHWQQIKRQERQKCLKQSSSPYTFMDSNVILWFELNQKWRPKVNISEPY